MNIVLATRNKKKVEEMTRMFAGYDIVFLTLDAFPGCPEVVEDGKTFRANALKKAVAVAKYTGCPAVADDSGLEVDALAGAPGVFSARYAGEPADDKKNVTKVMKGLKDIKDESERGARFVCCVALAIPDGRHKVFTGHVKGMINIKPKGSNGFGYDPIFCANGHKRTFAEMTDSEKDALSHRGKAMEKLYKYLKTVL